MFLKLATLKQSNLVMNYFHSIVGMRTLLECSYRKKRRTNIIASETTLLPMQIFNISQLKQSFHQRGLALDNLGKKKQESTIILQQQHLIILITVIPWGAADGILMMEIYRVLGPGGYWVLSGPHISWKTNYKA
uniref:Uncharacterized protein n=1 Tax=Solanum lycopersicum TaxID=4081 RepID=A0A3Q7FLU3_SOLLC